jgi:hypothetical protein
MPKSKSSREIPEMADDGNAQPKTDAQPKKAGTWGLEEEKTIRAMIVHEDDVTNHRLTWLVTLQGFLFAALGFSVEKQKFLLIPTLSGLGAATALSTLYHLWLSQCALRDLVRDWNENRSYENGPPVIGYNTTERAIRSFPSPWFTIPVCLFVAWVVIGWFWKIGVL